MSVSDVLVSTQWLEDHLDDPELRIVEVDVDTSAYAEGHVPGALAWDWSSQLQDQTRRDIISKQDLESLLSEAGIGNDHVIVLYGDNNNWFAAYAFWLLELYGHRGLSGHGSLKIVDGGRKKWLAEGRATTLEVPSYPAARYVAAEPNTFLRVRRDEVLSHNGHTALVDVRSPVEFSGELLAPPGLAETAQRAGHIPGAANVPWAQAVQEDGSFKDELELRRLYRDKDVTPDKAVIAYCRIGERSSHTWFVLRHILGYPNVKNYDGSWTEYGSLIDVPVEKSA